jgi:lipopolysaccharide export system protein LptA
MKTLNAQEIISNYRTGVRITVAAPVLRTSEGNYTFSGNVYLDRTPQVYCATVNPVEFQQLCSLSKTQTTTREGN